METTENITGYRTNHDGTQTLAWTEREDGTVYCAHDGVAACTSCVEADERLFLHDNGTVRVGYWPGYMIREGQTVRFDHTESRA